MEAESFLGSLYALQDEFDNLRLHYFAVGRMISPIYFAIQEKKLYKYPNPMMERTVNDKDLNAFTERLVSLIIRPSFTIC